MLHDLNILNVPGGHHGGQHPVLIGDPLLCVRGFGEKLAQRQSVEETLAAEPGQLRQLTVARVDGGQALDNLRRLRVLRSQLGGLSLELLDDSGVVLELICHVLVLLQETLYLSLVTANIFG